MSGHINSLCLSNKRALCIQEVRLKGPSSYTSTAASADILDIVDKQDVAVWNKTVRTQGSYKPRLKIGLLDQDLIREDKNTMLDSPDEKDVADVIISRTQVTDQIDSYQIKTYE
jgi:hypothetical protein